MAFVHFETIYTALALAALLDLKLWQVNFKSTFLNAPIDSNIYMWQSASFEKVGKENWVYR